MAINRYLAMTRAEITSAETLPPCFGYMACQFSPSGAGLSNCPEALPPGAMLILNDRTPLFGHDLQQIAQQLTGLVEQFACACVLLDFERPGVEAAAELATLLVRQLPCPVGVSAAYGKELDCPLFLPPVPPYQPVLDYLAPWQGRELWLELALDGADILLTPEGTKFSPPLPCPAVSGKHRDPLLHCHYTIRPGETCLFQLGRTKEDLESLTEEAERLGVTCTVGLWQELIGLN